jgi:predicted esterase
LIFLFGFSALAQPSVQHAECVGPKGAPVAVIYLHGLFPPSGSGGFYLDLEASNREQLTKFANDRKIRVAIPLAKSTRNGYRDWLAGKSFAATFADIEAQSLKVCGSLASPRALIGFSEGGYFTRTLAFTCRQFTKENYSVMFMSGAKPRVPPASELNCPNLVVASGAQDTSTETCTGKNCVSFEAMAEAMRTRYPNLAIEAFPGGHSLPPEDLLSKYLGPN